MIENEKIEGAWILYKEGFSQKRIAKMIGVTEKTIVQWKKKGDWENKLAKHTQLYETNAEMVQELIGHQLRTLKALVNEWQENEEKRLIGKGETDSLSKLYSMIKRKDIAWTNYIEVMKDFLEFLSSENLNLSKEITEYADAFLMEVKQKLP